MAKKKGKRHNRNQAGKRNVEVSSEEEEEGSNAGASREVEKKCPHLSKSVRLKILQNSIPHMNLGQCGSCEVEAVCMCLRCCRLGCDRSSKEQHSLYHYKAVPSHPVTVHLQNWVVWCYECDMDIPVQPNTELHKCISLLLKALKLSAPQDVQPATTPETTRASNISQKSLRSSKGLQLNNTRIKGLTNLGNTCFFNAVMQNLCQTELLQVAMSCVSHEEFSQEIQPRDRSLPQISVKVQGLPGPLTTALSKLFNDARNSTQGTLNPRQLFNEICKKAPRFSGYRQQDSQELLRYLLDSVKTEELKRVKSAVLRSFSVNEPDDAKKLDETSKQKIKDYGACAQAPVVDSVFAGRLVSIVFCHECRQESLVQETFLDLSLPLTTPQKSKANLKLRATRNNQDSAAGAGREAEPLEGRKAGQASTPTKSLSKHQLKVARKQERKSKKAGKGGRRSLKGQKRSDKDDGSRKERGAKSGDEDAEEDEGNEEDDSGARASDAENEDEFTRMNVSDIEGDGDDAEAQKNGEPERQNTEGDEGEEDEEEKEKEEGKEELKNFEKGEGMIEKLEEEKERKKEEEDKEGMKQDKNEICYSFERGDKTMKRVEEEEDGGNEEEKERMEKNLEGRKDRDGKRLGEDINTKEDEREEWGEQIEEQILDEGTVKTCGIGRCGNNEEMKEENNCDNENEATAGDENKDANLGVSPQMLKTNDTSATTPECKAENAETSVPSSGVENASHCVVTKESVTEAIRNMALTTEDSDDCQRTVRDEYPRGNVLVNSCGESEHFDNDRHVDDICRKMDAINEIELDGGKTSIVESTEKCGNVNILDINPVQDSCADRKANSAAVEVFRGNSEGENSIGGCTETCALKSTETLQNSTKIAVQNLYSDAEQESDPKSPAVPGNSAKRTCTPEESIGCEGTEKCDSELTESSKNSAKNKCTMDENSSIEITNNVESESATLRGNSSRDSPPENLREFQPEFEDSNDECESPGLNSETVAPFYEARDGELTVLSCLSHFCAPELLEGRNKFACGECTKRATKNANGTNEEQDSSSDDGDKGAKAIKPKAREAKEQTVYAEATKQLLIAFAPPVLTLHFKRFQQVGFGLRKVTKHVDFPVHLDLGAFCSKRGETRADSDGRVMYSLYGVVEHSGGMNSGHYTACVKMRDTPVKGMFDKISSVSQLTAFLKEMWSRRSAGRSRDGRWQHSAAPEGSWFYVSDSHVSAMTEASVLKRQAYMLFYERLPLLSC